jgi:hypothetical protein
MPQRKERGSERKKGFSVQYVVVLTVVAVFLLSSSVSARGRVFRLKVFKLDETNMITLNLPKGYDEDLFKGSGYGHCVQLFNPAHAESVPAPDV